MTSFDWEKGCWTHPSSSTATLTLCVAGDWAPIRHFKPLIEKAPQAVYGNLLPQIQSTDLSIVNLEAPLSDHGAPVHKSGAVFKGEQRHVAGLKAVPFDVVTLANNHIFDYGLGAFQDTLKVLEKYDIKHTGAGMSEQDAARPLVIEIKGIKIGIVNFSEGEDLTAAKENRPGVMGWDLSAVSRIIKRLKQEVDFVLAISHCGIEYIPFPPPYVADAFKQVAEAGADAVIGHHPHVPQGIAIHNRTPICYSLGNFVFYQETDLKYRKLGYMVKMGINKSGLVALELVPYQINPQGLLALSGQASDAFYEKLKAISLPLNDPDRFEATWHGFLHYYGVSGFFDEISMIMEKMKNDPHKGAAMFRNRLTTRQHYHHWKDLMTRIVDGKLTASHGWAKALTEEWLNTKLEPHRIEGE